MPSLLRRLTRISFRSEMLIINLLGLVNSTLGWVPLKWSSEVESVGSLPLTKESFAFNTISADRIRSILTWIVLVKVLVDNLYTVSYLSNIYSVITWSRPFLLIPWILFSFFKNFILEVLIFAIGTLLAFEERLPLFLLVEFVIVKVVQFNFASYTWYRNIRLYLFLKCRDRLLQLRKGVRSLSMATNGSNYSARPRSRSLVTVRSFDSSNANGFPESSSRIIDAPDLTPTEKAMKILNVSEEDIREARNKRQPQSSNEPPISSTNTDVASIPSTARGRSSCRRIENKTASFYCLETPLELPLHVSNMPLWSERGQTSAGAHQTAGKTVEVAEAPDKQITTTFNIVGKPDIPAQEPICSLPIAHVDNVSSSHQVTSSAEMAEKPCTSIMKRKEQKYCSAKLGIGECPIGKCTLPQKNSQTSSTNLVQETNSATDATPNKEPDNINNEADLGNRQKSDELKPVNSTIFFDANDQSLTANEGECDGQLSPNSLQTKRKLCCNKDMIYEERRKIKKIEEFRRTPLPEDLETVGTTEDNLNGTNGCQISENSKCEDVVATSSQSTISEATSEARSSESCTDQVLTGDIFITENVARDFKNSLNTRKYAAFIKSEESGQSKTDLQKFKSPYTKPRKSYYSQQKNRPTFYTSPKKQARETEKQSAHLSTCRRRLPRDSNLQDQVDLNNNLIGSQLDSQNSTSSKITIRPDRQKKESGVLKPRVENSGPMPLTETTHVFNFKNVTVRNPSMLGPVKSSSSINSIVEPTKDKESTNESRQPLATSGVPRTRSSAGRAARFKQVKALRGCDISHDENKTDSMLCQQNDDDLLKTGPFTEPRHPEFLDHCDKENICSHGPFKERIKPMHSVFYTETTNFVPLKSQNIILMSSRGLDDIVRPPSGSLSSIRKQTDELPEAEERRRLTKFSASKEEEGESSISAISSKKIEGQQKGKDLMRTLAKEDVRNVVAPGTSPSTSREPPIETQRDIVDKFRSGGMSENSSSVVNSIGMESEGDQQDTSASMVGSTDVNSSTGVMNNTIISSTELSKPALFGDQVFFSIHHIQDRVNDVVKTLDRLERKMDISDVFEHISTINIEEKEGDNDESRQVPPIIDACSNNTSKNDTDKFEEICGKEEPVGSQMGDLLSLETSPIVIDEADEQNEVVNPAVPVYSKPESAIESIDSEKSQILNQSGNDNGSPRSVVHLEKVLGTIDYNTDLHDEFRKIDHLETCIKPLVESTEKVQNVSEWGALPTITVPSEIIPESLPKSKEPAIERPDEDATETETARIPQNEEEEEPIEGIDTRNVPQPRLPITTIALFFILVINFYLSYFYTNVLKPVLTYTLSSIFFTILTLVERPRTSHSDPPTELSDIEEEVGQSESEDENIPEMKSDLLLSGCKSEVEEAADTERAFASLSQEQESMGTDTEPANSTNTEETITDKEVGNFNAIDPKLLRHRIFQEYRDAPKEESDFEDSFRVAKISKSFSPTNVTLSDSVQMRQSDPDLQKVAAQMANMIENCHLSNSGASTGTLQSDSGEDTISLGQGSSFEEFPKDPIPHAESQV